MSLPIGAAFAWLLAAQDPAATGALPAKVDLAALDVVEELSESLANDLLDLSVATRQRDAARTAGYFAADFEAPPFPSRPLPEEARVKWITTHGWAPEQGDAPLAGKDAFLKGWGRFLEHFSEIEDARFKVKQASFEKEASGAPLGRARVWFFVVGRDGAKRREWARGTAEVVARRGDPRWQIKSVDLKSFESMVGGTDLFSEISMAADLTVPRPTNPLGARGPAGLSWRGAAAADFNKDGFIDLVVASPYGNHLYLNDGQGHFRDVAEEAGVKAAGLVPGPLANRAGPVAPLVLDYDNDGDDDIFISAVGRQVLLENRLIPDGKLVFRDVSQQAGVAVQALGFSAVAGDVNGDGRPDIYVACYNDPDVVPNSWSAATNGTPNLLFVSQGDGTFKEEAAKWGVDDHRWSYAAEFADVDGDGKLDLYVANDYGENGLFINKGGRFVDEARERGVLDPGFGMGVSFGDYDNDGILDLHVTNMSSTAGNRILGRIYPGGDQTGEVLKRLARGNSLYKGLGDGTFRDVTSEAGPFSASWAWGGGFVDFDNDGWEDLYIPNGYLSGPSMKDT